MVVGTASCSKAAWPGSMSRLTQCDIDIDIAGSTSHLTCYSDCQRAQEPSRHADLISKHTTCGPEPERLSFMFTSSRSSYGDICFSSTFLKQAATVTVVGENTASSGPAADEACRQADLAALVPCCGADNTNRGRTQGLQAIESCISVCNIARDGTLTGNNGGTPCCSSLDAVHNLQKTTLPIG